MMKILPPVLLLSLLPVSALQSEEQMDSKVETVADDNMVKITEHYQQGYRNRVEVSPKNSGRTYVLVDSDENGVVDSSDSNPRQNDQLMMWSVRKW